MNNNPKGEMNLKDKIEQIFENQGNFTMNCAHCDGKPERAVILTETTLSQLLLSTRAQAREEGAIEVINACVEKFACQTPHWFVKIIQKYDPDSLII